jgi:hypothetical protein
VALNADRLSTVSPTLARGSAAGIAESVDLSMCGGNFPFELIDFGLRSAISFS